MSNTGNVGCLVSQGPDQGLERLCAKRDRIVARAAVFAAVDFIPLASIVMAAVSVAGTVIAPVLAPTLGRH